MSHDVAIVGLGRIGLPLALSFADLGLSVLGVDTDPERLATVHAGQMPFREEGCDALLARVGAKERLTLTDRVADAADARDIVFTLGTPALSHVEIDMGDIRSALDDLLPVLDEDHLIVLRSTVAPGTTDWVRGYVEQRRELRPLVAHVPERIAAGRFLAEIGTLPCIVGGADDESIERAVRLFSVFGAPVRVTTPVQAELAKIWTNILRYTQFALPNLLMMDCEQYGANVFDVVDLINRDYPRGGMMSPGLTAGSCLRKDFAFSEERSNAPGMLLAVSRVNESVPRFLVEGMRRRLGPLAGKKVAVLGLSFKRDTDDERDSLAHKLIRLLERELADVSVCDPHVTHPTVALEDAIEDAHSVVVATNHSEFSRPGVLHVIADASARDCLVVDPWNALGTGQVFAYSSEVAVLAGRG